MKVETVVQVGQRFWLKHQPEKNWLITKIEQNIAYAGETVVFYLMENNRADLTENWDWDVPKLTHAAYIFNTDDEDSWPVENLKKELSSIFTFKFFEVKDLPYPQKKKLKIEKFSFYQHQYFKVVHTLMTKRTYLNVLIHPLTDDWIKNRTSYAMWIGRKFNFDQETIGIPDSV